MASIKQLEAEIKKIKQRNKRVEGDKAWETSLARKGIITLFTYLTIALYLRAINIPDPWLNAIVPAVAFVLSTATLPFFKRWWLRNIYKKK